MGELTYFLGLQVKQLEHGTFLSHSKYCFNLLKKLKMEDCKEVVTPIATNCLIDVNETGQQVDSVSFEMVQKPRRRGLNWLVKNLGYLYKLKPTFN